jgi:hypothetical protein
MARLLVTKGDHGVDTHGAARGHVARGEGNEQQKNRDTREGQRVVCS